MRHTIVALFEFENAALTARDDLLEAGVPESGVAVCTPDGQPIVGAREIADPHEGGFFEWLFGTDLTKIPERHQRYWFASVQEHRNVLIRVTTGDAGPDVETICSIIDRHGPMSIDDNDEGRSLDTERATTGASPRRTSVVYPLSAIVSEPD